MTVQVALFRGINVGTAKRIAMAELKAMFEDPGFTGVRTVLNSGNVVFDAGRTSPAANTTRIAAALAARAGFSTNTLVIDAPTLRTVVDANPFADRIDDPSRMVVGFYMDDRGAAPLESLRRDFTDVDFAIGTHACYLWCPHGLLTSPVGEALAGAGFRDHVTTRNWATTLKLLAAAGA